MTPAERESPEPRRLTPRAAIIAGLLKPVRKLIVFVIGTTVILIGIAMIVLPGPATVVIPAGLAILATEFAWAQHWLNYAKRRAKDVARWASTPSRPDDQ